MTVSRRAFLETSVLTAVASRVRAPAVVPAETKRRGEFDPWLEIDAGALAQNVRVVSRLAGRPIIAVAKNNAYGCGLSTVGPLLDTQREIAGFAVVRPDEARALHAAGVKKPVLLMGPASDSEALELARAGVRLAVYAPRDRDLVVGIARKLARPVGVHLYVDTGMHRMGLAHDQVLPWLEDAAFRRAMRIEGAFTELTEDQEFDREQARRLAALRDRARGAGISLGQLHAASSDAIARPTSETFLDAVRPGLMVYGGYPTPEMMARGELKPAYRLKARVIRVDTLAPGEGVSYHRRFMATAPTRTATLAIGHVDGYPTGAVKGCAALIGGTLCPVIGTVSASHTVVSVADGAGDVHPGTEAILVGSDHPTLHPNAVAKTSDWSEYNMFMHLNPSLARVVVTA